MTDPRPAFSAEVSAAARRLAGVAERTPLERNARLSELTGAEVWLKREDLQVGRSYKVRGAYNMIAQLDDGRAGRRRGVRQRRQPRPGRGLRLPGARRARARLPARGRRRGRSATGSPRSAATWSSWSSSGDTYDDAAAAAAAHAARTGATLVPAFDDPRTVAGQGTVGRRGRRPARAARRTSSSCRSAAAGCSPAAPTWLRERAPAAPGWSASSRPVRRTWRPRSRRAGRWTLPEIDTFVDGAAVRRAGDVTYPLVRDVGCRAGRRRGGPGLHARCSTLYQSDGIIAEPAGALAAAALPATASTSSRARPSCACCPAATTTSAATPRSSSGRWCTRAASTTSWSSSRRSRARCAGSSTRCSARTTTSRCSSTSSATTARPAPALVGIELGSVDGLRAAAGPDRGRPAADPAPGTRDDGLPLPRLGQGSTVTLMASPFLHDRERVEHAVQRDVLGDQVLDRDLTGGDVLQRPLVVLGRGAVGAVDVQLAVVHQVRVAGDRRVGLGQARRRRRSGRCGRPSRSPAPG